MICIDNFVFKPDDKDISLGSHGNRFTIFYKLIKHIDIK